MNFLKIIAREAVGNSCGIFGAILGNKCHENDSNRFISSE